jgi:hypothetical protein
MPIEYANEHENRLSYRLVTKERMFANDNFSSLVRWSIDGTCRRRGSTEGVSLARKT